jgi:hypothetical protein
MKLRRQVSIKEQLKNNELTQTFYFFKFNFDFCNNYFVSFHQSFYMKNIFDLFLELNQNKIALTFLKII